MRHRAPRNPVALRLTLAVALGCCVSGAGLSSAGAETLNDALVAAYEGNPTLLAQRAQLRATDETLPEARSGWLPTVTADGDVGSATVDSSAKAGLSSSPRASDDCANRLGVASSRVGMSASSSRSASSINGSAPGFFRSPQQPKHAQNKVPTQALPYPNVIRFPAQSPSDVSGPPPAPLHPRQWL